MSTPLTNLVFMTSYQEPCKFSPLQYRNLGERCIYIRKVIMRKDTLEFVKEKYFSGHSDTRSVQENFDLLTSLFKTRRINICHRKLTGRFLQFPGIHLRYEGRFAGNRNPMKGKEDRQYQT